MDKSLSYANDSRLHPWTNSATRVLSNRDIIPCSGDVVETVRAKRNIIEDLGSDHLSITFVFDGDKVTRRGKPPLKWTTIDTAKKYKEFRNAKKCSKAGKHVDRTGVREDVEQHAENNKRKIIDRVEEKLERQRPTANFRSEC